MRAADGLLWSSDDNGDEEPCSASSTKKQSPSMAHKDFLASLLIYHHGVVAVDSERQGGAPQLPRGAGRDGVLAHPLLRSLV